MMQAYDSELNSVSPKSQHNLKSQYTSYKDKVLCKHCKRTSSNGIRCLGMCVADNDY